MSMRGKLLSEKTSQIKTSLERWAKRNKILKPGEQIVFTLCIRTTTLVVHEKDDDFEAILNMAPKDYFTVERLVELGVPRAVYATRACHGLANACKRYDLQDLVVVYRTVRELMDTYNSVNQLLKINNMGRKTVDHLVPALRRAGFTIAG